MLPVATWPRKQGKVARMTYGETESKLMSLACYFHATYAFDEDWSRERVYETLRTVIRACRPIGEAPVRAWEYTLGNGRPIPRTYASSQDAVYWFIVEMGHLPPLEVRPGAVARSRVDRASLKSSFGADNTVSVEDKLRLAEVANVQGTQAAAQHATVLPGVDERGGRPSHLAPQPETVERHAQTALAMLANGWRTTAGPPRGPREEEAPAPAVSERLTSPLDKETAPVDTRPFDRDAPINDVTKHRLQDTLDLHEAGAAYANPEGMVRFGADDAERDVTDEERAKCAEERLCRMEHDAEVCRRDRDGAKYALAQAYRAMEALLACAEQAEKRSLEHEQEVQKRCAREDELQRSLNAALLGTQNANAAFARAQQEQKVLQASYESRLWSARHEVESLRAEKTHVATTLAMRNNTLLQLSAVLRSRTRDQTSPAAPPPAAPPPTPSVNTRTHAHTTSTPSPASATPRPHIPPLSTSAMDTTTGL